jgi:hypothetical protein
MTIPNNPTGMAIIYTIVIKTTNHHPESTLDQCASAQINATNKTAKKVNGAALSLKSLISNQKKN